MTDANFHMNNARRTLNAGTQAQATQLKLI
jgi:DNA-binding transcriptional regulator WhiA